MKVIHGVDDVNSDEMSSCLTITAHLSCVTPPLEKESIEMLLRTQKNECNAYPSPERTLMPQVFIIRDMINMSAASAPSSETAWLLIEQGRLLRDAADSRAEYEEAVASCQLAVDMLTSMCTAASATKIDSETGGAARAVPDPVSLTLLDDLASAYTWHGICSREIDEDYNRSFAFAARLWYVLLQESDTEPHSSGHRSSFFSFPERTVSLLEALATLFGLLDQFNNQVLVFRLIELVNSRVKDMPNAGVHAVTALSYAGHSMQRMGHLSAAEQHFDRAQQALSDDVNFEYLLYHSLYLLEKGDAVLSESEMRTVLTQTTETEQGGAQQHATATAFSAELISYNGDPALATSLAFQAFRIRMETHKSVRAPAQHPPTKDISNAVLKDVGATQFQWEVISELLDSLFQMGRLHKQQGIEDIAQFYYKKGVQFSAMAKLPNVQLKFLLALADIYCKKHAWDKCSSTLDQAEAILSAETPVVRTVHHCCQDCVRCHC